jgi:CubicO group peptidase (beta-lactamase class C family)
MTSSVTEQSGALRQSQPRVAASPHRGRVRGMGDQSVLDERKTLGDNGAPAGGLSSSANDLATGCRCSSATARGRIDGKQVKVFSEDASQQMWTPSSLTPDAQVAGQARRSRAEVLAYALGWNVRDYRGEKRHRARRRDLRRVHLHRAVPGDATSASPSR